MARHTLTRRTAVVLLALGANVLAVGWLTAPVAARPDRPQTSAAQDPAQPPVSGLDPGLWQRAQTIARRILIVDVHAHDPFKPVSARWPQQITMLSMGQGRPGGLVQALPFSPAASERPFETILADVRAVKTRIDSDGRAALALSAADFDRIYRAGRPAVMLSLEYFQGLLDARVESLDTYYREGIRIVGLSQGGKDAVMDGEGPARTLSAFGRQVVAAMNRLGMACDLTHVPTRVRLEVIAASRAPVMASHTASLTVVASGFNLDDETIAAVAKQQGLIGITFCSEQLSPATLARKASIQDPTKLPPARVEDLVDHIDYLRRRVGLDVVAVGSDYGGSGRVPPTGLETADGLPLVVYHLLKRGYTEAQISRVMGGNFVRFLERVERVRGSR